MIKANLMLNLLQVSGEREMAEGRLRTLQNLALIQREWIFHVCLGCASLQWSLLYEDSTTCCGVARCSVATCTCQGNLTLISVYLFDSFRVQCCFSFSSPPKVKAKSHSSCYFFPDRFWWGFFICRNISFLLRCSHWIQYTAAVQLPL